MADEADAGRHVAERPDRGANPFLILLFVPVIAVAGLLVAVLFLPPIAGAAFGVDRIDAKLTALGADFTHIPKFPERSTIYAADGKTVLATLYLDNREIVPLDRVSKLARKAVLAVEDAEFYTHGALDWTAVIRALVTNAASGEVEQGGSTITTQLVKNAITGDTSTTFQRKFQELALALRVEQAYSKDEILALYLNDVYLGNGVYGIGTAADFYFHVPAKKLSLTQSATLAAMLKAPEYYDPIDHPVKTRKRRNLVLDRMAELGMVDQEKIDRAKEQPIVLASDGPLELQQPPFFVTYITEQIVANEDGEFDAFGRSEKQRRRRLYEGGLDIYTTLRPDWQAAAQAVANEPYRVGAAHPDYDQTPDTAIVSVENETGAIRTMLSGRNYAEDQLNLANSPRQPGSSFKPFTLVAAFREDIPSGAVFSTKSPLYLPEWTGNDCSCVSNAEGAGDGGYRNLWEATADSINVVFAQLILEVGPEAVVEAAHDMGITTELPAVPSLTLGTADVTPIEMASAYQTLANEGRHCTPFTVDRVLIDDEVLYQHRPHCKQVVDPEIAHLVTAMIQGGVQHGTGTAAALSPWPVAGKTGTTQDYSNVWFVGFTRQVSTAVWVGFPGTPDSLELYFGQSVFGGTVAAPIWHDYMARIMAGMPAVGFPAPPAPPTGTVPDVVGLKTEKAQNKIAAADFTPKVEVVDDPAPKGTVIAQTPEGGTGAQLGSLVTLQVSSGVAPIVKVPRVIGLSEDDARAALEEAGFLVEVVQVETDDPDKIGVVVQQTPGGGVKAEAGTTVTLKVGVEPGGDGGGEGWAELSRRAWS
ncbi:MAG TPA: transglycosylase domain-containing protein [Actinomycetota bacterium]|jgi:membrane peptidoglycan carboxypeptidase